jgi:hypothetical protein
MQRPGVLMGKQRRSFNATNFICNGVTHLCSIVGIWLVLAPDTAAQTSPTMKTVFKIDSYSLEHSSSWIYKPQPAPGGGTMHMFYGKQENNALAYCYTTQQPLNAKLAPEAARMNERQRRDFFLKNSSEALLLSLHHELASAQGFRLINFRPATLGKATPAFSADFFFRVPQGFVYRVRSFYAFWPTSQLVTWCQAVSKSESASDAEFLRNLSEFQSFFGSINIKER